MARCQQFDSHGRQCILEHGHKGFSHPVSAQTGQLLRQAASNAALPYSTFADALTWLRKASRLLAAEEMTNLEHHIDTAIQLLERDGPFVPEDWRIQ